MMAPASTNNSIEEINNNKEKIVKSLGTDQQVAEEEDISRPEAKLRHTIHVSHLEEHQQALSPACYARCLPWKILAILRLSAGEPPTKALGIFLQCNGESTAAGWSCFAHGELRLLCHAAHGQPLSKKIHHIFHPKEDDWGFANFILWKELVNPENAFVKDGTITLEATVVADAPHGAGWDSKKLTGYVGLKNQGATCYMNSLLQTLFFANVFRKAVYNIPTGEDDSARSVPYALQRVFYDLQFSDRPVPTKILTKSFGWETLDSFMQHDVQEFLRVLLDKLEMKMKATAVDGTIPRLFEGRMTSFIKCKNVNCTSSHVETFYDIQLRVKGKNNIYESFDEYVSVEPLEGENRYFAEGHGLQDAEKGVRFDAFPPLLHLHLLRFEYDPHTDASVKFNDRFEFYDEIDLEPYLRESAQETLDAHYTLHAVLVHSGDNHGGHYVVFLNTRGDGKWYKFDDDVVSACGRQQAVDLNFGGQEESPQQARRAASAYMLIYIKTSQLKEVLQDVTEDDIPAYLHERIKEETRNEMAGEK